MKESLSEENREDLVAYRMSRATETLQEADYIARGGYFNAAVNRLYYAVYYAASAMLIKAKIEASTHKGVLNQLGLHYISKGLLDVRYGTIYSRLFQARQAGDYEDFIYCDKTMYEDFKPMAEQFIERMKAIIDQI